MKKYIPQELLKKCFAETDIDQAMVIIQDHLGITDGGICAVMIDDEEWFADDDEGKQEMLDKWLLIEFGDERELPAVGQRVKLIAPVDRFPHFVAHPGLTGTVTEANDDLIVVKIDTVIPGAEEWNNEIQWATHNPDIEAETARGDFYNDTIWIEGVA